MRYRTWVSSSLVFFVVLALLIAPALAQEADKEDTGSRDAPADRKQASINLLVEGDPHLAKLMGQLYHIAGMEKIAREAGYSGKFTSIVFLREGRFVAQLSVRQIRQHTEEPPELVLRRLGNHLQRFLNAVAGPRPDATERREAAGQLAERSAREVSDLRGRLTELRRDMIRRGGGISPEGLEHQCRELQNRKMMLQVELAGLRARREAIMKHIAPRERRPATGEEDSRLKLEKLKLKKLETQLAFHERKLKRLQSANKRIPGTASRAEIERAHLKVEELALDLQSQKEVIRSHVDRAKPGLPIELEERDHALLKLKHMMSQLELAKAQQARVAKLGANNSLSKRIDQQIALLQDQIDERRAQLKQLMRSESLAARNDQLADVEIETATIEAKLGAIEKMLGRLKPEELQRIAEEMEEIRRRLEGALDRRAAAREELAELKRQQAELRPPKITVLDDLIAEDKNEKQTDEPGKEK